MSNLSYLDLIFIIFCVSFVGLWVSGYLVHKIVDWLFF